METYLITKFILWAETEILLIQNEENMTKVNVNNDIYYYEFMSQPNFELIGITVSMWKQHNFENIFNSDDVLNIQDSIGKFLGLEIGHYI